MSSLYPNALDVFLNPEDEVDTLGGNFTSKLLSAMFKVQQTLGANPSTLGTGFSSFSDIAALLKELVRLEVGKFSVTRPLEDPVNIPFASGTSRFLAANSMLVLCARVNDGAGRSIPKFIRYTTVITTIGGLPSGFDFRRWNMTDGDNTEDWAYLAMEDAL